MDSDTYCREVEAYLCRKNEGHLVRVVGPAFNMVSGWAVMGVPLKVACRGIDRYVERYQAKGPRRRPVRIEFCEADVLDAFDEWRRAVGVSAGQPVGAADQGAEVEPAAGHRPGHSLREHLDRVVTRLTDLQATSGVPQALDALVAPLIEQLAAEREASRTLRGDAREEYLARLVQRDLELIEAVRVMAGPDLLARLQEDAAADLAGFRVRMTEAAYARALEAATSKALRERFKLPTIAYS